MLPGIRVEGGGTDGVDHRRIDSPPSPADLRLSASWRGYRIGL